MHIEIIADLFTRQKTGVGNYVFNLINELNKICTDISLIHYDRVPGYNTKRYPNILKGKILETYSWYLSLPFYINKNPGGRIIHNPSQTPTFFTINSPYIITVHDITALKMPGMHKWGRILFTRMCLGRTLKHADKIIAVSHSTRKDLLDAFPFLSPHDIAVVHEAAGARYTIIESSARLESCRKRYGLPEKFILFIGTLEPRKNIERLLQAYASVHNKLKLPLVIAGKKGWKYRAIFEAVERLQIKNSVIFTGYLPESDIPVLYNLAEIFMYPALYEGFGLPVLEAMQSGCPVITSSVSSLPEVAGDAAVLVDPYSAEQIAESMVLLLSDASLRSHYRQAGTEHAKQFSWEKCARETLRIYREASGEH